MDGEPRCLSLTQSELDTIHKIEKDIELIRKDISELKQKQSDDRLDLLTKTVRN